MALLTYHLQVAAIQLLAYLAYRLLLADLPLGNVKRCYLPAALGLSFLVPGWLLLESTTVPPEWTFLPAVPAGSPAVETLPAAQSSPAVVGWLLFYCVGVVYTGTRFLRGIYRLIQQRKHAYLVDTRRGVQLFSLPTATAPHAFGRWVFYPLDRPLSPVVLAHECAHARQWHTLDRLLIGALRVVCWFNPVLWLYERAIRQNHELLADRAALRASGVSAASYQREILHWLRPPAAPLPLSSALSYAFTKKRLRMLTANLPASGPLVGRLLLLSAVWGALFFGFAERSIAQTSPADIAPPATPPPPAAPAEMTYGEYRRLQLERDQAKNPHIPSAPPLRGKYADMPLSAYRAEKLKEFRAEPANPPTAAQLEAFRDATRYRVWIDGLEVPNNRVARYTPADIFKYTSARPRYNPKNLTSIGLITHARRAETAARLAREAETFVPAGPPVIERVD